MVLSVFIFILSSLTVGEDIVFCFPHFTEDYWPDSGAKLAEEYTPPQCFYAPITICALAKYYVRARALSWKGGGTE